MMILLRVHRVHQDDPPQKSSQPARNLNVLLRNLSESVLQANPTITGSVAEEPRQFIPSPLNRFLYSSVVPQGDFLDG